MQTLEYRSSVVAWLSARCPTCSVSIWTWKGKVDFFVVHVLTTGSPKSNCSFWNEQKPIKNWRYSYKFKNSWKKILNHKDILDYHMNNEWIIRIKYDSFIWRTLYAQQKGESGMFKLQTYSKIKKILKFLLDISCRKFL